MLEVPDWGLAHRLKKYIENRYSARRGRCRKKCSQQVLTIEVPSVFHDGNRVMLPQSIPPPKNRAAVRAEGDAVREGLR